MPVGVQAGSGNKSNREALRREMSNRGCTRGEIAEELGRRWGFRPRQAWRHAAGLTQEELAHLYNVALGDANAAMSGKRIADYEAWPIRGNQPPAHFLTTLAKVLDAGVRDLVDLLDMQSMSQQNLITLGMESRQTTLPVRTEERSPNMTSANRGLPDFEGLISSTAKESLKHAERAEVTEVGGMTLADLDMEVRRIAQEHLHVNSLDIFDDTILLRNRVYRLLERKQHPRESSQLYFLAGILCNLLADTSMSAGQPRAALEQCQAGLTYGEIIGHNGLRFWARTMQASLAYWSGRPKRALDLVQSAEQWSRAPVARLQYDNASALFHACIGERDDSLESLRSAQENRDRVSGTDELFEQIGGMFAYPPAKQAQIATMTMIQLERFEDAVATASQCLDLYESSPHSQRAFGNEASAKIDLARAHLLSGEVSGATSALQEVLNLPPRMRQEWFVVSLKSLLLDLRHSRFNGSAEKRQLAEKIEDFCSETAAATFPPMLGS